MAGHPFVAPAWGPLIRARFPAHGEAVPSRSEAHHRDLAVGRGEAAEILRVSRGDGGCLVLQCRRDDECIDGARGRHACFGEQGARSLSDGPGQGFDLDGFAPEQLVDGSIALTTTADFRQDGSRNAEEGSPLVSDAGNGTRTQGEGTACRRIRQRVDRFGVEDQRFGHSRRTRLSSASGTGPRVSSSSSRNWPSASRSSSRATARATNDESPRVPARLRAATAILRGMLMDSFSAASAMPEYYSSSIEAATDCPRDQKGRERMPGAGGPRLLQLDTSAARPRPLRTSHRTTTTGVKQLMFVSMRKFEALV